MVNVASCAVCVVPCHSIAPHPISRLDSAVITAPHRTALTLCCAKWCAKCAAQPIRAACDSLPVGSAGCSVTRLLANISYSCVCCIVRPGVPWRTRLGKLRSDPSPTRRLRRRLLRPKLNCAPVAGVPRCDSDGSSTCLSSETKQCCAALCCAALLHIGERFD